MTTAITLLITAVIVAGIIFAAKLVGWNITNEKLVAISSAVYKFVRAAEQQYKDGSGKDKKAFVLELISSTFGTLAEKYAPYISAQIEGAVYELKTENATELSVPTVRGIDN